VALRPPQPSAGQAAALSQRPNEQWRRASFTLDDIRLRILNAIYFRSARNERPEYQWVWCGRLLGLRRRGRLWLWFWLDDE